jgi:ankyrin repeat protein
VPREELTATLLLTRNEHGDTPLHAAAFEGHLDQLPQELLTAANLSVRNYAGITPLKAATLRGHSDQLPEGLRPKNPSPLSRLLGKLGF